MVHFLKHKRNIAAIQWMLLIFLAGFDLHVYGQKKDISIPIKQSHENSIKIVYQQDDQLHCNTPIRYTMRKEGTTKRHQVVKWTIRYVPCNKQEVITETISFPIPKGTGVVQKTMNIKTRNLVSAFDDNLTEKLIEEPEFTITGPTSVMEGDEVTISLQPSSNPSGVKWVWAKGSLKNEVGTGTSIRQTLTRNARFYAYANIDGFMCSPRIFEVNVIKRPDAPADFVVSGPREITDIESATLTIDPNSTLEGVRWIWEQDNKKVGEGQSLTVNPRRSTTYKIHSEYFHKRSPEKSFTVNVHVLPSPPNDFQIAAPGRIREGDMVWLRVGNQGDNKSVKWIWFDPKTKVETTADSILVYPDETTTYSLMAELSGKFSSRKTKTIEVIQKAAAPEVVGEFSKCISSAKQLKFTLKGGKLGTGSRYWNWYEGDCGAGKLIHRGNELNVNPSRTTTYYVQPENNKTVCRQFTVEVGQMPELPERLLAAASVCYNQVITIEAVGSRNASTQWHWFVKRSDSYYKNYKGDGASIQDTITGTTQYMVVASNNFCKTSEERTVKVEMADSATSSSYISVIPKKGRRYVLSQIGGSLAPGYKWVWYKGDCEGNPIGYGEQIDYKAHKSNKVLVRAEGNCGPTACTPVEFAYSKTKSRFIFVNFGLTANSTSNSISENNAQLTIGSNSIYLRGRAPVSLFLTDNDNVPGDTELETNNSGITNYPANTNTYYVINGKRKSEVYSVSGGFLMGGRILKLYVGGGYGKRTLYWGADIFNYSPRNQKGMEWARHLQETVSGAMVEGGAFLRLGALNLSAGMNMITGSKVFLSFDAGVGITFKRK